MNSTISKGEWGLLHDEPESTRGRPGGSELDALYVRIEQLASVLQEKYGLSRTEAMRKVAALKRAFNEEG